MWELLEGDTCGENILEERFSVKGERILAEGRGVLLVDGFFGREI